MVHSIKAFCRSMKIPQPTLFELSVQFYSFTYTYQYMISSVSIPESKSHLEQNFMKFIEIVSKVVHKFFKNLTKNW